MDPWITGAAISAAGNVLGGMASQANARDAYRHRYRDTVHDMKKAGLNPALAYGQNPGGGAQTHDFGDVGSDAASAGASASSAAQARASTEKTKAETALLKAQTADLALRPGLENARIVSDTHVADRTAALRGWESDKARADAHVAGQTTQARIDEIRAIARLKGLEIPRSEAFSNFATDAGSLYRWLQENSAGLRDLPARLERTNRRWNANTARALRFLFDIPE